MILTVIVPTFVVKFLPVLLYRKCTQVNTRIHFIKYVFSRIFFIKKIITLRGKAGLIMFISSTQKFTDILRTLLNEN